VVTGTVKRIKSTESDTLYLLLNNEGQYVTKKTIMQEVWGGRIVSENNITQSISQLRIFLGDSGKEQKIIKTKPREGYMLLPGNIIFHNLISKDNIEKKKTNPLIK
jgi:DNA-binding winged helix-turn-helix (wHTH) protein